MLNQTEDRIRATGRARAAACAVTLLIWAAGAATPTSTASSSPEETYRWTGELVALNEGTGTLTVKARVLSPAVLAESDGLRAGDSIVMTWTGFGDRASGVWSVARANDAADASIDGSESEGTDQIDSETRFPLPATFEAIDADSRQLTFRVPLPAGSRSAVRSLTRGARVSMTSPRHPADAQAALLAVNAYVPSRARRPALAPGATYRWDGELVALDEAAGALTVRAQMVSAAARSAAAGLTAGEPIVITWSGYGHEASGIRAVAADDGSGLWGSDRYLLPATFEAAEAGGRQLTFRVPLPAGSRGAVRSLTRGAWARMTSPHHPADAQAPLLAVNAYVPSGEALTMLAQDATYRWGGELVALDETAGALTVRAQMVSAAARSAAAGLTAGEPIVITWSGYGHEASGIRAVAADDGSGLWGSDRYLLPATFEAAEAGGRQLTFRVPLPAGSRGAVRSLTRGAWARMTSPHHPANARPPLLAVNSYVPSRQPLQAALAQDATYRWDGELVALDEAAGALTVRAQMVSAAARSAAAGLTAGEPIVITWSGYGHEASGIRAVAADDGSGLWGSDRYLLPATFEAAEAGGRQLTFRVPLPAGSRSAVRSLTRGAWARMTSPHHPADAQAPLLAVNAYVPSGEALTMLAQDATYRWGGELVALDETAGALTVRAQMVSAAARSAAAGLTAGEPIVITWSGYGHEASGIRAVAADDGSGLWGSDRYLLPATFEAAEAGGRQLTFRVPLPAGSRGAVRSLTRGAWARMTSPHHPANARPPLLAVNSYVPSRQPLQAALAQDATYRWDGELVALDETAGALTVRAQMVSAAARSAAAGLTAGEPIVITWSGYGHEASGIRVVAADDGSGLWGSDRYLLPATFEAAEAGGRQLTFRVPLPAGSRGAVRSLTRGAWARMTSPHHPADAQAPLLAVNSYVPSRQPLPAALAQDATYRWGGELVALDETAGALTVRAQMVSAAPRSAAAGLTAGEPIVITWSGYGREASGIRAVAVDDGSGLWGSDRYLLPATFEAAEAGGRQLTFRVPLPAGSRGAVRSLTRGAWARMTSPHHPADAQAPLLAVNSYVPSRQPLQAALAQDATYRWDGELVALDEAAGALTIRAEMVSATARSAAAGLAVGEPIVITWSGHEDEASGIRAVAVDDGSGLWGSDRYLLRATFEAVAAGGRQLTFRIPLPDGTQDAVQGLAAGAWVRMTSPHHPADARPALLAVNAYTPAPETPHVAAAGGEKTYVWPGKLISIHAAEGAVTVSAPAEQHVFRYVERFSKGDGVVLVWAPGDGYEVTAVRYLQHRGPEDHGRLGLDHGYVLPAEFVSGDEDSRRITFKTKVPATSFDVLAGIQPGQWVKVTSPFDQRSHAGAAILAVERDAEQGTQAQE